MLRLLVAFIDDRLLLEVVVAFFLGQIPFLFARSQKLVLGLDFHEIEGVLLELIEGVGSLVGRVPIEVLRGGLSVRGSLWNPIGVEIADLLSNVVRFLVILRL